ncbi:MAG: hybrid sensor histidine kinase/response regulator [Bacteroidales bacterium]
MELKFSDYRILVVDDVEANLLLVKAILSKEGFSVSTALNGLEALKKVESGDFDLFILDVMMPLMDGYQTAMKLRENPDHLFTPIIFLTALDSPEDIVKGFSYGGNDFISKPFNKDELITRVKHQISLIAAKRVIEKQNADLIQIIQGRDKMYSVIAHDLRGPLGSMKMILDFLNQNLNVGLIGAENKDMLLVASQTSEDVFQLLDNLLKWTKNQMGRLNVVFQELNLEAIAQSVIEVYRSSAQLKGISLHVAVDQQTLVRGDSDMIKTVLRNIIGNAIKFSYSNSSVDLSIVTEQYRVVVHVKDTGCGITEEDQQKLLRKDMNFTRFGTNKEEGSGLGLLLCQELMHKMNGELWFESSPGEGSVFSFSLPRLTEE